MHFTGVDDAVAGQQHEVVVLERQPEEEEVEEEGMVEAQTAVVSVVEAGSHEVLHQVHFTMEVNGTTLEQQVSRETHLVLLLPIKYTQNTYIFHNTFWYIICKNKEHLDLV